MPDNQTWMLLLAIISAVCGPLFVGMCMFYMRSNAKTLEKLTDLAFYHEGQIKSAHAEIKGLKSDITRIERDIRSPLHGTRHGEAL